MTTDTAPVFRLATYLTVRVDFAFKASSGHTVKARAGQVFWVTSNLHLQSVEQAVRVARKGKGCTSHGYCFKPEDIERFFIVEEAVADLEAGNVLATARIAGDAADRALASAKVAVAALDARRAEAAELQAQLTAALADEFGGRA